MDDDIFLSEEILSKDPEKQKKQWEDRRHFHTSMLKEGRQLNKTFGYIFLVYIIVLILIRLLFFS